MYPIYKNILKLFSKPFNLSLVFLSSTFLQGIKACYINPCNTNQILWLLNQQNPPPNQSAYHPLPLFMFNLKINFGFNARIILTDTNYDNWFQIIEMHIVGREKLDYIMGTRLNLTTHINDTENHEKVSLSLHCL